MKFVWLFYHPCMFFVPFEKISRKGDCLLCRTAVSCLLMQCIFNQVHNLQFLHSGGKVRIRLTRLKTDDSIFQRSLWSCGFQMLLLFSVSYEILHFKLQMCCLLIETVKNRLESTRSPHGLQCSNLHIREAKPKYFLLFCCT